MENQELENKNEELQSRRDFFKEAAKKTLPILGAVVLANIPFAKAEAAEEQCWCGRGCQGYCNGACTGKCAQSCSGSCSGMGRGGIW